jgi:aminopeptidase N
MLRYYLGDDAFFKSLNKYLTDNKFKTGEAQQLRLAFESITGKDLNWYWNEWYYGAGHPVLDISYNYDDAAHKAMVIVQQQQKGQIFKMPVNIDIYNGSNKTRHQVWIQNAVDTFTFSYVQRPDLINFDGDKILLCQKTDHKTADNFKAQWKYAPLFVDRHEALEYFADNNMVTELSLGLNDKFKGIRSYTLDRLKENENALANAPILMTVQRMVQNEPDNKTKAKAISFLAATKDPKYKSVYEQAVGDSSYSVSGAAHEGLSNLDPANAYALAQKYAPDAKGKLDDVITSIIVTQGNEADYDMLVKKYEDMGISEARFDLTPAFCDYLSKLNDTQKIKNGIDKVVSFWNSIPQQYKDFADPVFKASLQKIAAAKGGDVQAYVDTQLKLL